jgi:hypothetical protein
VCKFHGSIDWIVADRQESPSKLDLLFDKSNANRLRQKTGHVEDDRRLWRYRTWDQLEKWISGREFQSPPKGASLRIVGIAGLGSYKPLHTIPGLGQVWWTGIGALCEADAAIVVGFSMSNFDAMAQMAFAEVARARHIENRPLHVTVIDPRIDEGLKTRFRGVFRQVEFVDSGHETVDWSQL